LRGWQPRRKKGGLKYMICGCGARHANFLMRSCDHKGTGPTQISQKRLVRLLLDWVEGELNWPRSVCSWESNKHSRNDRRFICKERASLKDALEA
jgi:hypothetical protein